MATMPKFIKGSYGDVGYNPPKYPSGMDHLDPADYGGTSPNASRYCSSCGSSMEYEFHWGCWICSNPDC